MSRMGVDQDHEIICKPRVLDARVCSISGGLLRPLEHTVHLIEVDITEQRGDHSTLWNAAVTIGFQHDLQQVHHVIIVDSLRHLGQQPVVPNVVKVAPQIKILFRGFHGSLICYGLPGCSAPCTDLTGFPAIGAFYFQASNGLVALPVAGYDYSIDRTLCWRDFHPQEWQLDSLHNTRPS